METSQHPDSGAAHASRGDPFLSGAIDGELAHDDEAPPAPRAFAIFAGGPFNRWMRRLHVLTPTGAIRTWKLVAFAWLPLPVGAVLRALLGRPADPLFLDLSVHTRFLVALPLLILSQRLLDGQCRSANTQLYGFAERAALDRVFARAERLRDSAWVEGTLAALAVAYGQLVLWGATGPTGVFAGVEQAILSVVRIWYASLALPLLIFLALRWLWRWTVWTGVLVRVSRLPLAATATHPDGAAGLRFLSGPVTGFAAFELAVATVLAAAWGTQLMDGRVTVPALLPTLIAFLLIAVLVACGPLLLFTPHVYRAQRAALLSYGPFALDYVRRFHGKWREGRPPEQLLGNPDIQSLADLANSYRTIESTSMFVVGKRKLAELWLAAVVPMLPLVATVVSVDQLLRRMGGALFGGIPL
jgi:hypothetical protein